MLVIRADLVNAMVAHARRDHPDEACGVLAGPEGSDRPERHIPMTNAERSPTFYRLDSGEQLKVWRAMEDADEVPVVIYHSHTATEAYPSRTDVMTLAGLSRFVWATAIIWILGGLGTWLIGNVGSSCGPTDHIGASGLIFGWLAFLLVFGLFVRKGWDIVIGLVVLFVYGGILLGAMPVLGQCGGVSWQGHLSGAVAGVVAAFLLSAPERKARALKRAGARSGHPKL